MESAFGRHSGENELPALTTPLSYKGTPEELDAELGRELAGYVESDFRSRIPPCGTPAAAGFSKVVLLTPRPHGLAHRKLHAVPDGSSYTCSQPVIWYLG